MVIVATMHPTDQRPTAASALRGPADAVAALPHLLGFAPQESLIAIWVRDGAVALTQRIDLPDADRGSAVAGHLIRTAASAVAPQVLLVVATGEADAPTDHAPGLPFRWLVDRVSAFADEAGVEVLDALLTDGQRFWSYRCTGGCCPPQGRRITPGDIARMAAVFEQAAPQVRRTDLESAWATDPDRAALVEPLVEEWESDLCAEAARAVEQARHVALESWRDAQLAAIESVMRAGCPADPRETARVLVGLADVRVRDTIVWQLGQGPIDESAREVLADALRCAPPGYAAPVATVLALACWQCGDGARATMALERALADDPDYRLAHLAVESISSGIPPSAWLDLLRGMPRERCRQPSDPGSHDDGGSV